MIPGHAERDFNHTLTTLIERFETWSPTPYFNHGDVPTVGYGVAFIFKAGGRGYQARTLADLNDWFTGIHAFTQAEHNALASIADALTRHDETTAMQEFRNWGPASSLRLTEAQGELVLSRAVPDVTANAIPHDIVQDMAGTRELAVLYSLAYNAIELVGNKLETAIINDDLASAWYEIRYQSNDNEPQFLEGIAKRRYAESQYFGLYDDAAKVSETDARETFGCSRCTKISSETMTTTMTPRLVEPTATIALAAPTGFKLG